MELGSIFALCIVTLIIVLVQLFVIAGLAGYALPRPWRRRWDEENHTPEAPLPSRSLISTIPAIPHTATLAEPRDSSSSLYSNPPRPPNPTPYTQRSHGSRIRNPSPRGRQLTQYSDSSEDGTLPNLASSEGYSAELEREETKGYMNGERDVYMEEQRALRGLLDGRG